MSVPGSRNPRNTVSFGEKLAASDAFKALFREGMKLVEECAAYLDGPGRTESRGLPRQDALTYASESMRLTTRLMQLASWLLLQRAVNEGEMTHSEAAAEKHKVKLAREDAHLAANESFARLPRQLQDLVAKSLRLQARIQHLDRLLYRFAETETAGAATPRPLDVQIARLRAAFERGDASAALSGRRG